MSVDVFSPLLAEELPALHERMRLEGLLDYVVGGDGSLAGFEGAFDKVGFVGLREDGGKLAGFWWLTFVGEGLWSFHFCLFRAWRSRADELFQDISAGLSARLPGFAGLVFAVPRARRDLRRWLVRNGASKIYQNNKELSLWVRQ